MRRNLAAVTLLLALASPALADSIEAARWDAGRDFDLTRISEKGSEVRILRQLAGGDGGTAAVAERVSLRCKGRVPPPAPPKKKGASFWSKVVKGIKTVGFHAGNAAAATGLAGLMGAIVSTPVFVFAAPEQALPFYAVMTVGSAAACFLYWLWAATDPS